MISNIVDFLQNLHIGHYLYFLVFMLRNGLFLLVIIFIIYTFFSKYVFKKKIEKMENFILSVANARNFLLTVNYELSKSHIYWPKWYYDYYYSIRNYLQLLVICMVFSLLIEQFFGFHLLREIYPLYLLATYLIIDNLLFVYMDRVYIVPNLNEFYKNNEFFSIEGDENINPKKNIINRYLSNFKTVNWSNGLRYTKTVFSIVGSGVFTFWIYNDWYATRYPDKSTPVNRIWDIVTGETTPVRNLQTNPDEILKLKDEILSIKEQNLITKEENLNLREKMVVIQEENFKIDKVKITKE